MNVDELKYPDGLNYLCSKIIFWSTQNIPVMKKIAFLLISMFVISTIQAQYSTPGMGVNWTMDDLVTNSDGVIILNGDDEYEILENLNILTLDTISFHTETIVVCHPEVLITINGVLFTELELQDEVTFKGLGLGNNNYMGFRFENSMGSFLEKVFFKNAGGIKLVNSMVEFLACGFNDFNQDNCSGTVDLYQSHPTFTNCEFVENAGPAVLSGANAGSSPQIDHCYLFGNVSSNTNMPQVNLGTSGEDSIRITHCDIIGNIGYEQVGGIAVTTLVGGELKCRIEGNGIIQNRYGITQYGNNIGSVIRNNVIEDNDTQGNPMLGGSGINFFGNESNQSIVSGNKISGNLWGITIQGTAAPNFGELENDINAGLNQFFDNGNEGEVYDFYNNTPGDIMAENNYWGTMDPDSVEMHIFHQPDDPTLGIVDYLPLFDIYTRIDEKITATSKLITALFPNPANQYLSIRTAKRVAPSLVQLFDITGRLYFSQEFFSDQVIIPVNDFEDGAYFLKVSSGPLDEMRKVLIQK